MTNLAVRFIPPLIIGYLLVCGVLYWQQENFFFHPTKLDDTYTYSFTLPFDEIDLPARDATINVVRFRANDPKGVILYAHGNGDVIFRLEGLASYFVSLGYDVVIPDYRGYGKSTGSITNEADLHADMEVVYDYLLKEYNEDKITIYAQSMGTGFSVPLAAAHSPKQLILESPFYSLVDLVRSRLPVVPGFLVKYQLRSDELIDQVKCPIYVIHGDRDRVIPFDQGERLYELIESQKEFLHLEGADHGPLLGDERLRAFLEKIL